MNISKFMDDTVQKVDQINWEKVAKDVIKAWDLFFKIFVIVTILTYLAGESLGNWVHHLNDWLAHHWVRLIVPSPSVETGQALIIVEEVSTATPTITEVEPMLPPAPLVVADPWHTPIEVELMLPQALEPMAVFFTTPQLMIAAVREPVALLAPELQEQQTPARRRRRQSTPKSPQEVVKPEAQLKQPRRHRGRGDHERRHQAA